MDIDGWFLLAQQTDLAATQTASETIAALVKEFLKIFMSIVYEALPFVIFGAVLSGAMEELLPQQFFTRFLPRNRSLAIVSSSFLGILLPMCECGIVAVMRRLIKKGVPVSCAVTYMLSAPVINPIVLLSTAYAFSGFYDLEFFGMTFGGGTMMFLRAGGAFLTAVAVGLLIDRLVLAGVPVVQESVDRVRLNQTQESNRLYQLELGTTAPDSTAAAGNTRSTMPERQPVSAAQAHQTTSASAAVATLPVLHQHTHQHEHGAACNHDHHDHDHKHGEGCNHSHNHDHSHNHNHDHHHNHGHHHNHDHGHDHHHGPGPDGHQHAPQRTILQRLLAIADIALGDFLDIAAFLVIGAFLAALVNVMISQNQIESLSQYQTGTIFLMMGLAFVLSLCSEADAFVAANFKGISLGSKLAFLCLGPMLDVKLLIMYRWVFTRRAVLSIVVSLLIIVFLLGFLTDLLAPMWLGISESATAS